MALEGRNLAPKSEINRKRKNGANRGRRMLVLFAEKAGNDRDDHETNATDLLADLMHLCDEKKIDFYRCMNQALRHYCAECMGEF